MVETGLNSIPSFRILFSVKILPLRPNLHDRVSEIHLRSCTMYSSMGNTSEAVHSQNLLWRDVISFTRDSVLIHVQYLIQAYYDFKKKSIIAQFFQSAETRSRKKIFVFTGSQKHILKAGSKG